MILDEQTPKFAQIEIDGNLNKLGNRLGLEYEFDQSAVSSIVLVETGNTLALTPLSGCINPGDPECNGVCESGDNPSGPDCDGACGSSDSPSGPDCNGVCGAADSPSGPDCDGICDPGENSSAADCNGACDLGEQTSSADCDGFCDVSIDHPSSVDCSPPLPAELISFEALVRNCSVALLWKTAAESNVSHYSIERKVGNDFLLVGSTDATGNSLISSDYEIKDPYPAEDNIYRLSTHDFDGKVSYSKMISVHLTCENRSVTLSPNPARDFLSISGAKAFDETTVIRVFSVGTGVILNPSLTRENGVVNLDISELRAGVYILQIKQEGSLINHRFIKQ